MKALRFLKAKWQNIAIVLLLLNLLVGTALPALADAIRIQAQPALNDIADVNAAAPSDDDVLSWDDGTSKWVDRAIIEMGEHGNEYHDPDFADITSAAVNLYVDIGSGDDGNAGTSGSPMETITGALDTLPATIAHTCTINVRGQQDYPESNTRLDFSRFNTLAAIIIKTVNSNDENMYDNGLATGGGNDDLDDSGGGWSTGQFNGAYIWIYRGTGVGQVREILDTTSTRIVISTGATNWAVNPDSTSYYTIGGGATMTGTDSFHAYTAGKRVSYYGLRHTGCTSYGIYATQLSITNVFYNYFDSLVHGMKTQDMGVANVLFNFFDCSGNGIVCQTATMTPRANLFLDCDIGAVASRMGIMHMSGSNANENYFENCDTGISLQLNGGALSASGQGFNCITDDIVPTPSENMPRYWN